MLEYLNENERSERIKKAIAGVIMEGRVRTYDMLKLKGSPDVFKKGAASTREMAEEIVKKVRSNE